MAQLTRYKEIFAPASPPDCRRAFGDYWAYLLVRDGALHEQAQALEHKTTSQTRAVRKTDHWLRALR